jgi:hypothetical protein
VQHRPIDVGYRHFSDLAGPADDVWSWGQNGLPLCAPGLLSLTRCGHRPLPTRRSSVR